jgi:hypothetical protein
MLAKLFVRYGVVVGVQKTRQSCSLGVAQKKKKDVDGRRLLFATSLLRVGVAPSLPHQPELGTHDTFPNRRTTNL